MKFKKIHFQSLPTLSIFISIIGLWTYGIIFPEFNWDIVGYVASSYHLEGVHDPKILHNKTYRDIELSATAQQYREIVSGNEYRKVVAQDPVALLQQLPFYTIRVAYVRTITIVSSVFQTTKTKATYYISAAFAALFAGLLFTFFYRDASWKFSVAFPIIIIFSGVHKAAVLSTPDTMAACMAILAVILSLKKSIFTPLVLVLMTLCRTDFIILSALLSVHLIWKKKMD